MSVKVQLRRDTAANIATATPAQGEFWFDTTNNRGVIGDGSTAGGIPMAKLSEAGGAAGVNGSAFQVVVSEVLASGLSGGSATLTNAIPAGAIVVAVAARVTTAITGATSFSLGYAGSTSAFGSGLSTSSGATSNGEITPTPFANATNVIITAAGGSFASGAVRVSVMYFKITPPTS